MKLNTDTERALARQLLPEEYNTTPLRLLKYAYRLLSSAPDESLDHTKMVLHALLTLVFNMDLTMNRPNLNYDKPILPNESLITIERVKQFYGCAVSTGREMPVLEEVPGLVELRIPLIAGIAQEFRRAGAGQATETTAPRDEIETIQKVAYALMREVFAPSRGLYDPFHLDCRVNSINGILENLPKYLREECAAKALQVARRIAGEGNKWQFIPTGNGFDIIPQSVIDLWKEPTIDWLMENCYPRTQGFVLFEDNEVGLASLHRGAVKVVGEEGTCQVLLDKNVTEYPSPLQLDTAFEEHEVLRLPGGTQAPVSVKKFCDPLVLIAHHAKQRRA